MKKVTLQPFLDYVLVKPDAIEEKTASGIYKPDTAKEKPLKGTVISVGDGTVAPQTGQFIPTTIKKGQRVLHGKYQTTEIEHEGEVYLLMKESNIQAIL